jgi:hypothetical protein
MAAEHAGELRSYRRDENGDEQSEGDRHDVRRSDRSRDARVVVLPASVGDLRGRRHLQERRRPAEQVEDGCRKGEPAERTAAEMPDDRGISDVVERLDDKRAERRDGETEDAPVHGSQDGAHAEDCLGVDTARRRGCAAREGVCAVTSATVPARPFPGRIAAALLVAMALVVAVALGVYARVHTAAGRPIFTLWFSGMLQMKVWLTTAALLLLLVQLVTALWMWGRLPAVGASPAWLPVVHRWSGTTAFVLTLPVAVHCMWALGFGTQNTRVVVHSLAGCLFYGAYAAKMLGLRIRGLPGWVLPVVGGSVLTLFVAIWLTAALWFFTRSGLPLT